LAPHAINNASLALSQHSSLEHVFVRLAIGAATAVKAAREVLSPLAAIMVLAVLSVGRVCVIPIGKVMICAAHARPDGLELIALSL